MPYKIYTKLGIGFIATSFVLLMVSKFYHPSFENDIIINTGQVTIGDILYYNGENAARFFGLLGSYYFACIASAVYKNSSALMHSRYVCLLFAGVSFVRLNFEFFTYNRIGLIEVICDLVVALVYLILIGIWYYKKRQYFYGTKRTD